MSEPLFTRKRGSMLLALYKFSILPVIAVVFFLIVPASRGTFDFSDVLLLVALCFGVIARAYGVLITFYTTAEDHLLIESGLLQKKKRTVFYETVTSIDFSQSIPFRIFGVQLVTVENAGAGGTVLLALKNGEAEAFREYIHERKAQGRAEAAEAPWRVGATEGTETPPPMTLPSVAAALDEERITLAQVSLTSLFKLGFLRSKIVYYFTVYPSLLVLSQLVSGIVYGDEAQILEWFATKLDGVLFIASSIVLLYLLVLIFAIGKSVLTLYDFRLARGEDNLYIQYGLLVRKKATIPLKKISGVILEQSLFMRLAGCYTARVAVIGRDGGNDSQEAETISLLFPIGKLEELTAIFGNVLPELEWTLPLEHVERPALRYFFYRPSLVLLLACLAASLIWGFWWSHLICAVIMALVCVGCYLNYKNSAYALGETSLLLVSGGYLRRFTCIRRIKLENVSARGSVFKRRRGYATVRVGMLAEATMANAAVCNLRCSDYDRIVSFMPY